MTILALIALLSAWPSDTWRTRPPPAPTVAGPRSTSAERPVYRFRAAGAVRFRCAFDSTALHSCAGTYSEPLDLGRHVLRVRSVGRTGAQSRLVAVSIRVIDALPRLVAGKPIAVGAGAGVPAVAEGQAWVPTTDDGKLVRVVDGSVRSRTTIGASPPGEGYLDSAVSAGGAVWASSDGGATVSRIDAASGTVAKKLETANRPGGLTQGDGSVWAFHFLQGTVTRIDTDSTKATRLAVAGAGATGIAYGDGSVWLLTTDPSRLLRVDPKSGAVLRSTPLQSPFPRRHFLIDTWWLAYGDGALWATLPNFNAVARIDAATGRVRYVRLRHGRPFGVAVGAGSAWVATDRALVRLNGSTGAPTAAVQLRRAVRSAFVSVAYGDGAAWVTNYEAGTIVRVSP